MSAPVTFTGARPVAQHCAELLSHGNRDPLQRNRLPEVAAAAAARLGEVFSRLLGGTRVAVSASAPRTMGADEFTADGDALSACFVLSMPGTGGRIVLRLKGIDLLRLTEQVFGGDGGDHHEASDALPLTASLLAAQLQALVATALSEAMDLAEGLEAAQPGPASATAHAVLDQHATWQAVAFTLRQPGRPDCAIDLAVCPTAHAALLDGEVAVVPGGGDGSSVPIMLAAAGIPIGLRAVIAELSLPLSSIARLRPGDTVPLAMARGVRLKAGDLAVADATVGSVDGQVALQLVRVF